MDNDEWTTGRVKLRINGQPVELEMTVPAGPVKLQRIIPIFQQLTNMFVDAGVAAVEAEGKAISCTAGCGACCRQPVPIAEAEVYQIAELVEAMPEPRRGVIKARFAAGVAQVRAAGWFDAFEACIERGRSMPYDAAALQQIEVVLQYFRQGVPCPFLEDESCSIHASRPLACREYLVTSPARNCATPIAGTVHKVDVVMRPSRSLAAISRTGRMNGHGLLLLILALELAEAYPDRAPEKTGSEWMMEFFRHATGAATEGPGVVPEQGLR
ncbi:MAG: zinc/iron-chelating protein [Ramlibacter sp.]|nr:zinc/iron-chelating protein [Ramlibacter sp.]